MRSLAERIATNSFALIAEIGVNYYDIATSYGISPMDAAKLMCSEAKKAGVHAVKFQTYKAESLAASESPSYWDTSLETSTNQRELFKRYDSFGEREYREIAEYCSAIGIEFFSTAFDCESADYLEPLMGVYKISSSDLTNHSFIQYQAEKGKPIIMSVGAGNLVEIREAVNIIRKVNRKPLALCHCVLEYPTDYSHANLSRITSLKREFPNLTIGYSDHCKPDINLDVIKTSFILGARIIEKHFTLDKTLPGNDHYHAMDAEDAKRIIKGIDFIDRILGDPELHYLRIEDAARHNARRSIVSACNIPAGMTISQNMLTFKRPGIGIPPNQMDSVVGTIAKVDIPVDSIIDQRMLGK